jgi:glycolate oxidase subunit GlcD
MVLVEHLVKHMKSQQNPPITIHPGTPLVTVQADVTLETLNTTLQQHDLCLPIAPLQTELSLASLIEQNEGGRRALRHGAIVSYLRAATILEQGNSSTSSQRIFTTGGPTIKRATGFRLHQAWINHTLHSCLPANPPTSFNLLEVTLSLKPLPPMRRSLLFSCAHINAASSYASSLLTTVSSLSALAILSPSARAHAGAEFPFASQLAPTDVLLLVEFEDRQEVLDRQTSLLQTLANQAEITLLDIADEHPTRSTASASPTTANHWQIWEDVANAWHTIEPPLAFALPRCILPTFVTQVDTLAERYGLTPPYYGDIGSGLLHMRLQEKNAQTHPRAPGEKEQIAHILRNLAQSMGGAWATAGRLDRTENGTVPLFATAPPRPTPSQPTNDTLSAPIVLTRPEDRACYDTDASIARPDGHAQSIMLPTTTQEVSHIMRMASARNIPVVTRGAGSGLAGGAIPIADCLLLALTRMQEIHIDTEQMVAHVQAGVITADLQRAAEEAGLFYPPDPSSQTVSTIGGNIACNAGGPRCLKYGVTADYVLGLTAVLADGRILHLGDGLTTQPADAGLLHLLIGSEGTLAIITAATLRLIPQPPARRTALAIFNHLEDACATVEAIMAAGVIPAALELMDDTTIGVVEDYMHLGLPRDAGALLLLQSDGAAETVEWESQRLAELARQGGARDVQLAQSKQDETALWKARRSIGPALARLYPNKLGEDISVPVSQVAATVRRVKEIAAHYELPIPVFGHAGDGNLHPNILFNGRDPQQAERVWLAAEAIFAAALERGGTLSGEHGIGTLKRPFMAAALGEDVLDLHYRIKATFDPQGLLNPGKVLPDRDSGAE